jgi:hypothetical protein
MTYLYIHLQNKMFVVIRKISSLFKLYNFFFTSLILFGNLFRYSFIKADCLIVYKYAD